MRGGRTVLIKRRWWYGRRTAAFGPPSITGRRVGCASTAGGADFVRGAGGGAAGRAGGAAGAGAESVRHGCGAEHATVRQPDPARVRRRRRGDGRPGRQVV